MTERIYSQREVRDILNQHVEAIASNENILIEFLGSLEGKDLGNLERILDMVMEKVQKVSKRERYTRIIATFTYENFGKAYMADQVVKQ